MNTDKILGYVEAMIDDYICKLEGANDPMRRRNLSIVIENLRSLKKFTEAVAQEGRTQEQSNTNFSPFTGEKLQRVCPKCWVKGNKPYNCGFKKCPGYKLLTL